MPKVKGDTDKFNFYWGNKSYYAKGEVTPTNIKEILEELLRQYADYICNGFRIGEEESLNFAHNSELIDMIIKEMKVCTYDSTDKT